MTLQQLRYLAAVAQSGWNITAAAQKLRTSQPAMSNQIKRLERELGFSVFKRSGRSLIGVTQEGERVVEHAMRVIRETQSIRGIVDELRRPGRMSLTIGTTHTQARYVLPATIKQFLRQHPQVQLHLHQGTAMQIAEMARLDRLDLSIVAAPPEQFSCLVLLPWYTWSRYIIVPVGHPLAAIPRPSLGDLVEYPLISYLSGGRVPLEQHFAAAGLRARFALTAHDADVAKTYVRLRLGVGIIAAMAYHAVEDADLKAIDATHLFPAETTWIGFVRGTYVRHQMHEFIQLAAPHLTRTLIEEAAQRESPPQLATLFRTLQLPHRSANPSV